MLGDGHKNVKAFVFSVSVPVNSSEKTGPWANMTVDP